MRRTKRKHLHGMMIGRRYVDVIVYFSVTKVCFVPTVTNCENVSLDRNQNNEAHSEIWSSYIFSIVKHSLWQQLHFSSGKLVTEDLKRLTHLRPLNLNTATK